ncbi:ribonuclease Z [Patescibacteria group bacterium]|nr:ribonuclease Z [Patescibacteria group bacterium]
MKIVFLGTGEAFDENNPNNSHLVISKEAKLLLDCGFTTPYQLWRYNDNQNLLDAAYISHLHGDHYFGLPALLVRMWEEGRTKPLTIICKKGFAKKIKEMMEYAYRAFSSNKFEYKINFIEVNPEDHIKFKDLNLSFALGEHSSEVLAVRIDNNNKSICYSGDGMFTEQTERLYKGSDLVIQETYLYDKKTIGHASIVDAIKMAERNDIKCLALTHINRNLRPKIIKKKPSSKKVKIIVPNPLDKYKA